MSVNRSHKLPVKHPGLLFKQRFLTRLDISVQAAADKLHISRKQLSLFINGHSAVSISLAKKLEIGTGVSAEFWLNRQKKYDLYMAQSEKVEAESLFPYAS